MVKHKNSVQAAHHMELRLIAGMKEDLDEGFGAVVETYRGLLIRVAKNLLQDTPRLAHLAEDAVQDGLINALLYLREYPQELYKSQFRLRNWLVRVISNQALHILTAGQRHLVINSGLLGEEIGDEIEEGYTTHYDDPVVLFEQRESRIEAKHTVHRLLATLSPEQREAIVQKYLSETDGKKKTYEQVAADLGRPVGTVKSQIHHAKAQMREQIEQKEGEEVRFDLRLKKKTS